MAILTVHYREQLTWLSPNRAHSHLQRPSIVYVSPARSDLKAVRAGHGAIRRPSQPRGLRMCSRAVGGMVLARALDDDVLGNDFLAISRRHALRATGWDNQDACPEDQKRSRAVAQDHGPRVRKSFWLGE